QDRHIDERGEQSPLVPDREGLPPALRVIPGYVERQRWHRLRAGPLLRRLDRGLPLRAEVGEVVEAQLLVLDAAAHVRELVPEPLRLSGSLLGLVVTLGGPRAHDVRLRQQL